MKILTDILMFVFGHCNEFNLIVLMLTFLAITGNTIVTWKLKNLTSKQITFNIKPIIICDLRDFKCKIRNIGNGPALYIKSDKMLITIDKANFKAFHITEPCEYVSLEERICLEANSGWEPVSIKVYNKDGGEETPHLIDVAMSQIATNIKEIIFWYEDVEKTKHGTIVKNINGHFKVIAFK